MKAWKESHGKLLFYTEHELRIPVIVGTVAGLVSLIAGLVGGCSLLIDGEGALFVGCMGGTSFVFGAIYAAWRIVPSSVDPSAQMIKTGDRDLPFVDVGFVFSWQVAANIPNGGTLWCVGVVPDKAVRGFQAEAFGKFRSSIEGAAMPEAMAGQLSETAALMASIGHTIPLVIGSYYDPRRAWLAGEMLARTIHAPLLDLTDVPLLRRVDQLDMPLQDLLAREILPTQDPGPVPEGISVQQEDPLVVSFSAYQPGLFWLFLSFCAAILALISCAPEMWVLFLPLAAPFGLLALAVSRPRGRRRLTIDDRRLVIEGPRRREMPLVQLEAIRERPSGAALSFHSDQDQIDVGLPSPEAAQWLRKRISVHIKRLGESARD